MDTSQLAQLIDSSQPVRILDVRTPGEFGNAHIEGAYNVPLDLLHEHVTEMRIVTDTPVVLVCQSGQRATKADVLLRAAAMPNVQVLDGGMNAWIAAGHPAMQLQKRVSLERQIRMAAGSMVAVGAIAALVVSPWWALVPAFVGSGLAFSGATDTCAMGMLMAKLPYNRSGATCDTETIVRQFVARAAVNR